MNQPDMRPLDLQVMDTIEPVGYLTRRHKDGVLVADGGKIISESFLASEDVVGQFLYTEYQMREAIEKAVALATAGRLALSQGEGQDAK